jgi:hypothetical protein
MMDCYDIPTYPSSMVARVIHPEFNHRHGPFAWQVS